MTTLYKAHVALIEKYKAVLQAGLCLQSLSL